MSSFKSMQLLLQTASMYQKDKESVSRQEIVKKINQIKYLSKQKKSSKFQIRKEIVRLENKLDAIFELEKNLLEKRKVESKKITSLKRQLTIYKKKLVTAQDEDLQKKVDRLSHLLGDFLAKKGTVEDVALTKKVFKELHVKLPFKEKKEKLQPQKVEPEVSLNKLQVIKHRLQLLKHELELKKQTEGDPQIIKQIEEKVAFLDQKLQSYMSSEPITSKVLEQPRHTVIFKLPKKVELELEKELPLPPPPKMAKA